MRASLSHFSGGGKGKPSLNRANKCVALDPKPGELTMSRVKLVEIQMEARTGVRGKALG